MHNIYTRKLTMSMATNDNAKTMYKTRATVSMAVCYLHQKISYPHTYCSVYITFEIEFKGHMLQYSSKFTCYNGGGEPGDKAIPPIYVTDGMRL